MPNKINGHKFIKLLFLKTNTESEDISVFLISLILSISSIDNFSLFKFINSPDLTPQSLISEIHESLFKQSSNLFFQLFSNLLASFVFNPPPCANRFLNAKKEVSVVPGLSGPYQFY